MPQHPFRVRGDAGEQTKRLGGLKHRHAATVEHVAAARAGGAQQVGEQRHIDDVRHP